MFVLSLILVIVGVLMLLKPSIVWSIAESWKSNDATEPSDLYLFSARFGGVLIALAGIGGIVVSFL